MGNPFGDDDAIEPYKLPMSKGVAFFFAIVLCFVSALGGWMLRAWFCDDDTTVVVDCSSFASPFSHTSFSPTSFSPTSFSPSTETDSLFSSIPYVQYYLPF